MVTAVKDIAATRVVSPTPGIADFQDIQSALNSLTPGVAGRVLLREGYYPLPASLTPLNGPVEFLGCGRESVILDTQGNSFPAFTFNFDQPNAIRNLSIRGNPGVGQPAILYGGPSAVNRIILERLHVGRPFSGPTDFPAFGFFAGAAVKVEMIECDWAMSPGGSGFLFQGAGLLGLKRVNVFGNGRILDSGAGLVVTAEGCNLNGDVNGTGQGSSLSQCEIASGAVIVGFSGKLAACRFGAPATATLGGADGSAIGCDFAGASFPLSVAGQRCSVSACDFPGNGGIQMAGSDCAVGPNSNCRVVETSPLADRNVYTGNQGFFGSIILGPNAIVDDENVKTINGNISLGQFDRTILAVAPIAGMNVILPNAAQWKFKSYTIVNLSGNPVTLMGSGGQNINGSPTQSINTLFQVMKVRSDGTQWFIVGN